MFENLTPRERILAVLLSTLVPISLTFVAIFWFIQKYGDNNLEIIQLGDQIGDEETKTLLARKALKRLDYYQDVSLPRDFNNSAASYQLWLLDLARRHNMPDSSVKPQPGAPIKFRTKEIAKSQVLKLNAEGTLEEITSFLHEFYSLGTLHRVRLLKLTPVTTLVKGAKIRTGKMTLIADIEIAILNESGDEFDFQVARSPLKKTLADYQSKIVNRNVFGPPNNAPLVKVSPSSSYASNSEVKINVRGEDADKDDTLEFSLLDSAIAGAKLEPKPGTREATLILPPMEQGTYELKIGVKDSGFPAKETDTTVKIVMKDPPNNRPAVTAKLSNPYAPDRPIEIVLEGTDRDERDRLKFAIVSGVEGAEIRQQNDDDRNPILLVPPQEMGEYSFVVSVSDGRESQADKLIERPFTVIVERKFSHLNETRITSIVRERSGDWFVNVRVRTLGNSYFLGIGDHFEIEKQKWTVQVIRPNEVVFGVGDQLLTLEPRVPFSTPVRIEDLALTNGDDAADVVPTPAGLSSVGKE